MGYSSIIDSLVSEDMSSINKKNTLNDAETLVSGILSGKLSKVKKNCIDDKYLKMLFNKSKLGKNNKKNLVVKYSNNVYGDTKYRCLVQIYSVGKEEYITFTFNCNDYLGFGISYICHYDTDTYGSATTSLDFDAGEVHFSDIEDGVYGKIEGITLYDLKKDEYIGNKDNASAKIFNNFAKNIVKEIPSFKDVFEEYADGFEDCRFRVEVDYEEYGVFVGIVFISSEDDFCELVYDELEDTKEFLVNSYNGELSFEVRI